jgi:hypothetical protein
VVALQPLNLRWVGGAADDPHDHCAHGEVVFSVGGDLLLGPGQHKDLTVSAAALYLLRTLSRPHTRAAPVGDHLFPCCGFALSDLPGEEDVVLCGCPGGEDFEVLHEVSGVGAVIRTPDGRAWRVPWTAWRSAVFAFADEVSDFYACCSPKVPADDEEARALRKFAAEWGRRRGRPLKLTITSLAE